MEKTIYLHIGLAKTGTTSLQYFLFENRVELAKLGISYPIINHNALAHIHIPKKLESMMEKIMPKSDCEFFYKNQIIQSEKVNARLFFSKNFDYLQSFEPCFLKEMTETKILYKKRFEACFLKEIEESSLETFILSEEAMSQHISTLPHFINMLFELGFNVKIIAYVRPVVDWLISLWKQRSKISMTCMNLNNYCFRSYDVMALNTLYLLIKIVGKESVILRPYEKEQWKNHSIIDDFLEIFNIDRGRTNLHSMESQNISPSIHTTEIFRLLTASGALCLNDQKQIREKLLEQSIHKKNYDEMELADYLSDREIEDIIKRTEHLYARLANIYGKQSFFINKFPICYGKKRNNTNAFGTLKISQEELEIVLDVLNKNRQEKDTLIQELQAEKKKLLQEIRLEKL